MIRVSHSRLLHQQSESSYISRQDARPWTDRKLPLWRDHRLLGTIVKTSDWQRANDS